MSTSSLAVETRRAGLFSRAADYLELTKPKIAVLVLVTAKDPERGQRSGQSQQNRLDGVFTPHRHGRPSTGMTTSTPSSGAAGDGTGPAASPASPSAPTCDELPGRTT